jgi:hypothetical protein
MSETGTPLTVADLQAQKSAAAEVAENQQAQAVAKQEGAPVVNVPAVDAPVKSPQEVAAAAHAEEEARRAAQTDFDPKLHGVGTHPAMGPQNVAELTKFVLELAARVAALEGK